MVTHLHLACFQIWDKSSHLWRAEAAKGETRKMFAEAAQRFFTASGKLFGFGTPSKNRRLLLCLTLRAGHC